MGAEPQQQAGEGAQRDSPEELDTSPGPPSGHGAVSEAGSRPAPEVGSRSGRYALITALVTAVISSFVSAGAAVYVSINESNRSSQLAASEAARESRQKLYREFLSTLNRYEAALSETSHLLIEPTTSPDLQIEKLGEVGKTQILFVDALNTVWMTGSHDMFMIADRFVTRIAVFSSDHYGPFVSRYISKNTYPTWGDDEWRKATSSLGKAALDFLADLGEITSDFLKQARKDLA
ncbi:hypothetical protein IU486_20025 [Streptomyces gardneri]|uniref:hypothetical protein n=1 Tax=Nocardia TaxID=1817 RepID=UPI00135BF3A8|nr:MULTISPECIES: hypothetical protein [Nocardia]MBF6167017.1 hypothetical protein [Streptomyces gardneri]MBF6204065.1 hypothetical protein [Streptomyces gardneri]